MQLTKKLEQVLKTPIKELKETSYGITNQNFIVKTENEKYFCRIPKDTFFIKNKDNEKEAIDTLKGEKYFLSPVYYDANLLITKFQENAKTFISSKNLSSIIEIAKILKSFHSKKFKTSAVFNPLEIFEKYTYQLQNPKIDYDDYKELLDSFSNHYNPDRLCHNDLKEGNFLFTSNKIYLIDYEYAGLNDPYFDIASFIAENDLNYQETITFLKAYFTEEKCNFEKLSIFLQFCDLLWYSWACLLYERSGKEKYKTIADEKYKTLKNPRKVIY